MDKADSDFLQHLFRENNNLRGVITNLRRQLHNATSALEETEIELRNVKLKSEEMRDKVTGNANLVSAQVSQKVANETDKSNSSGTKDTGPGKDSAELKFITERQEAEITQLNEELEKTRNALSIEQEKNSAFEKEVSSLSIEIESLRSFQEQALEEKDALLRKEAEAEPDADQEELKRQLKQAQMKCDEYRNQLLDFANETNQTHNAQQNQLQGVEAMMEGIRDEYEEFITITRNENEAFQSRQKSEYTALKQEYEEFKFKAFEEKKRTMMEYQNILTSMQAQFDEYRATTEMMFNIEMVKLEEEMSSQASRYEQEIMYIIQAKDKFYMDMMITKDAKIMGLIEGSDLQNMMQKHEMDMENLRKEHAKDVERVKSEHESESKNVMLILQRQNVSLESKTEKMQSHMKTLELRMKELMNTIDAKNKTIAERDELREKVEADYLKKLEESGEKMARIIQEKERLRHKVIRLNLHAKGEGENSIENMIKRLSIDTNILKTDFDQLGTSYTKALAENQELTKKLREKEKLCTFLEKEVERRGQEFKDMTATFEEFLAGRAKQARHDRNQKLLKFVSEKEKAKSHTSSTGPQLAVTKAVIKSVVPDRGHDLKKTEIKSSNVLDRGYVYLKRFKNLSKAFASGDFRPIVNIEQQDGPAGPWQKTPLYAKLEDTSIALAKLYNQDDQEQKGKMNIYKYHSNKHAPGSKVYEDQSNDSSKIPRPESSPNKAARDHLKTEPPRVKKIEMDNDLLIIGGKHID